MADAGKVSVSDHDESDPFGETRSAEDPLGPFEAFKAARAKEPAAPEPFPESFGEAFGGPVPGPDEAEPTAIIGAEPGAYGPAPDEYATATEYAAPHQYTDPYPPPPPGYGYPEPVPMGDPGLVQPRGAGRGRVRSTVLFGVVAVLAVGLGAGIYAATQSSSGRPAASAGTTASAPASAGASTAAKGAKAETVRLTVTAVSGDSFTGTTAAGKSVTARIAATTKFGTAARPFTRAQLVPGADIYARLRRETGGTAVATVIAAGVSSKASGAASASPSAGV